MIGAGINCCNVYAIKKTALDVAADYVRKRRRVHCVNNYVRRSSGFLHIGKEAFKRNPLIGGNKCVRRAGQDRFGAGF